MSMSPQRTSLSMFHQIAKQMDEALRGLNEAPDKLSFIYLGVSVNMLIEMGFFSCKVWELVCYDSEGGFFL